MASESSDQRDVSQVSSAPAVDFMAGGHTTGPPISDESNESSYTQRDLLHYHFFGRRGIAVDTKATLHSWRRHLPFVKPIKVKWKIQLSEHNLLRLLYGYTPLEMPDKWFIYADGPSRTGKIAMNFFRSWIELKVAELLVHTIVDTEDDPGLWTGEIVELTYEGDEEAAERIADASVKTSPDGHSSNDEGAPDHDGLPNHESDVPKDLDQEQINETIIDKSTISQSESSSNDPAESRNDERGELWAKFLVTTSCKWTMGIDLNVDISEPKRWTELASQRAKSVSINQTTYMGTSMPQETVELLQRLGPGTIVTFS